MHAKSHTKSIRAVTRSAVVGLMILPAAAARAEAVGDQIANAMRNAEVVDLTVLISEQLPAHWPTMLRSSGGPSTGSSRSPVLHDNLAQSTFPYYGQRYLIDEHTGTQPIAPRTSFRPRAVACRSPALWAR